MLKYVKNILKLIRKHVRIAIALFLVMTVALGFFVTRKKEVTYKTTAVTRSTLSSTVSASGKVVAKKEAELHFLTAGKLAWVGVKEGDSVSAWQGIASLDKRELEKNLTKALRDYSKERNDFEEDRQVTYLYHIHGDTLRRILEKNQWDLDKAVLDVEIKDLALQYANLVTPIAGIVTRIDAPVAGVNVAATDLFVISDPSSIIFEAEVDETDIGQIQLGQTVKVILDSYPEQEFAGTVSKIGFSATTTTSGGTAFIVDIALPDNSSLQFKPGMNGDVEIVLEQKENVLTVPVEAVFQEENKSYVYTLQENKPLKKEIQTGIEGESTFEVISGVGENEIIITNPDSVGG